MLEMPGQKLDDIEQEGSLLNPTVAVAAVQVHQAVLEVQVPDMFVAGPGSHAKRQVKKPGRPTWRLTPRYAKDNKQGAQAQCKHVI